MKFHTLLVSLTAALALPAYAQQSPPSAPGGDTSASGASGANGEQNTAAAREALKKKEGDTDQTSLLKQTLTAVDKQYSLIKRDKLQVTYDLSYTYIGQEKINANFTAGNLTLFNLENDSAHTITNTLSADYGLADNLTGSLSVPVVSKYSENPNYEGLSNSLGDIGLGARWQPVEVQRDHPSMTFVGTLHLPTGRSPFKVDAGKGLATGAGVASLTAGMNVNHIVDPVALFGSVNLTASVPAKHLSQVRDGQTLNKVAPGLGFGFGMGFAYALSYNISTSFSVQEMISAGTKLTFKDGTTLKTKTQTSGVLNFGLGYRVSPKTTVNMSVGIGLTVDSPNLIIGMTIPLEF